MGIGLTSILFALYGRVRGAGVLRHRGDLRRHEPVGLHHQGDLSGFGSFLFMGLIGIIIASLVNLFMHSSMMQWVISVVGVLIFTGLTAYDTQRSRRAITSAMTARLPARRP